MKPLTGGGIVCSLMYFPSPFLSPFTKMLNLVNSIVPQLHHHECFEWSGINSEEKTISNKPHEFFWC